MTYENISRMGNERIEAMAQHQRANKSTSPTYVSSVIGWRCVSGSCKFNHLDCFKLRFFLHEIERSMWHVLAIRYAASTSKSVETATSLQRLIKMFFFCEMT